MDRLDRRVLDLPGREAELLRQPGGRGEGLEAAGGVRGEPAAPDAQAASGETRGEQGGGVDAHGWSSRWARSRISFSFHSAMARVDTVKLSQDRLELIAQGDTVIEATQ